MLDLRSAQQRVLEFLNMSGVLKPEEQAHLFKGSMVTTYTKGDSLVDVGQSVNYVHYLMRGIVRYYVITEDGQEVTKAFYKDSFLIGSFDVTFNDVPSKFAVQALTEVAVLKIPIANIRELIESSHAFSKAYCHFIVSVFIQKEQREVSCLSKSAKERLEEFEEECPEIASNISGVVLASYLGVSAVQLSRIKHK